MLKNDKGIGLAFLLPSLVLLVILIIYPLVNAFWYSLNKQMIYEAKGTFIGFGNYVRVLQDEQFWSSLKLSISWTLFTLAGQLLIGTLIGLLMNKEFKGRNIVRALVLLPFFIPTVSATLLWRWLLNPSYGFVSYLTNLMRGADQDPIMWLTSEKFAFVTVIFIAIWRFFPFVTINVLARLQVIPNELYEAGKIDGANSFQLFRYITAPEIKEVFLVVALLRGIFMLKKFDIIYMLTKGGPGTSTSTLPLYVYQDAFSAMNTGRGSASALLLFLITLSLIMIYQHRYKNVMD